MLSNRERKCFGRFNEWWQHLSTGWWTSFEKVLKSQPPVTFYSVKSDGLMSKTSDICNNVWIYIYWYDTLWTILGFLKSLFTSVMGGNSMSQINTRAEWGWSPYIFSHTGLFFRHMRGNFRSILNVEVYLYHLFPKKPRGSYVNQTSVNLFSLFDKNMIMWCLWSVSMFWSG